MIARWSCSGFGLGFLTGAVLATAAPFVGALVGALLHDRNMAKVWGDWGD